MLRWMKNYYKGASVKNPAKIREQIDEGKFVYGIYLITLSENPGNLLEILPAAMLLQKSAAGLCPLIIGMDKGKESAMETAAGIITEVYEKTGGFGLEEYMKNR